MTTSRADRGRASSREDAGALPPARRFSVGAEFVPGRGVHFRVWAPRRRRVEVVLDGRRQPRSLQGEDDGYFAALVEGLEPGARYRIQLDGEAALLPDPASRFQPDGPHGPSEVIDATGFVWSDAAWRGLDTRGQVVYELHVGTFTEPGNWESATARLPYLCDLGVTALEVMPITEFAGTFGWGYDGVDLYAPYHGYGRPDDLRRFIDAAHALGLGVLLDVVYNHFGPDGNYLRAFSDSYFARRATDWGDAIDFDGDRSGPVRAFFIENAAYWIADFHFDGLRLDATQDVRDRSSDHVIAAIVRSARAAAGDRSIVLVAENEPQDTRLVRAPEAGGFGVDALWNDDLHHSAVVALTGRREAYYSDHAGAPQEFLSAAKYGYLFQGQRYAWQKGRRGTSALGIPPRAFVAFLENHDQVANSESGARLWRRTSPGRMRAMTALLLLGPWTPMLFQGQEWCSSRPFLYFADHHPELAKRVHKGRRDFLRQFPSYATPAVQESIDDPAARATFERSRLDWSELERDPSARRALALHRDLLRLRRTDAVLRAQGEQATTLDGAVLAAECFVLRYFAPDGDDRLIVVNLGSDLVLSSIAEPLVAPPRAGAPWQTIWSSEDPRYGGSGLCQAESEEGWRIPGQAALLLAPRPGSSDGELAQDRMEPR